MGICSFRTKMKRSRLVTTIFGILLLSTGLLMILVKSWLLKQIFPTFVLQPHSVLEEFWRKPPVEILTNVYVFNWTNPEDIRNRSIKPKFEELGPYRFMQTTDKLNIVWNGNHTVTYQQRRIWRFDESRGGRNLSDTITTMNILTLCTAHKIKYWNFFTNMLVSTGITTVSPNVHVTRTVHQILYEGYDEILADVLKNFFFLAPELEKLQKFGMMSVRNGSLDYEGVYNMGTGIDGNFQLSSWNYKNQTVAYEGVCANVRGSIGELHGHIKSRDVLPIFFADFCRTFLLEYDEDVIVDDILGYKYYIGNKILDNGTIIPENKCYCNGECLPSGMLNVSSCLFGLPILGSLPNFYLADPFYVNSMEGLKPDRDKHETYIIVEPETGIPLKAVLRVQLNIFLHSSESIAAFRDVPDVYFPLLWLEVEISLPDRLAGMLKVFLRGPFIYTAIANTFLAIGILLIVIIISTRLFKKMYTIKETVSLELEEPHLRCDKQIVNK